MIFLIAPALIPLIAALVTAGGTIGGAAISRGASRGAIRRQNEYNLPVNQVRRLAEAGLPHAAMINAQAGNQSQAQPYTESGVGEAIQGGIQNYIQTTQQKKAIEAIDAQIEATNAQRDKTLAEKNTIEFDLSMKQEDPTLGTGTSYVSRTQNLEYEYRQLQNEMARMNNDFRLIENVVQRDLYYDGTLTNTSRQQLKNLMMQSKTMQKQIDLAATQIKANDIQNMLNEGLLKEGVLSAKAKAELNNLIVHGDLQSERIRQDIQKGYTEQLRLSNATTYELAQQKILMQLIRGLEKNGLSVSDAFFHTLLTGGFRTPNISQFRND